MLDNFSILTTTGVVLWSRTYSHVPPSVINGFISDVFIEERNGKPAAGAAAGDAAEPYRCEQHTLKWALAKDLGVMFVVVYRSLLHLSWIDTLVDNIKTIFIGLYGEQLRKPHTSLIECHTFDEYFDQQLTSLESTAAAARPVLLQQALHDDAFSSGAEDSHLRPVTPASQADSSWALLNPATTESPMSSRPSTPAAKLSRRARKAQNAAASAPASSGDEAGTSGRKQQPRLVSKSVKKGRKWDVDGLATEDDDVQLDYSASVSNPAQTRSSALEHVDSAAWGTTTKGKFVLKDLDDEVHALLAQAKSSSAAAAPSQPTGIVGSGLSTISGLFRNVIGGKTLTAEDLAAPLKGMEEHLLQKNVAREAAVRLCESVERELVGVKTANFETIRTRIQQTMESTLTKMLTPTSSLDLLREIDAVVRPSSSTFSALRTASSPRPYVLSIVGVNGVGKSTNLSKIAYFLLQNKYRVLIAAGDTFRSGAVEQLAVHVRNLSELAEREGLGTSAVELYQKGYGKDAATVAKDAVTHAASHAFDVVLIDTAGRRHNDQRLMSSLEKFAKFAQPDKILMVAEALVGTDSVAQSRNFNAAFGSVRQLDGFIISKCDTVGDMVGSIVSLVHATAVPVLFVGVGQHYSDLRNFSVKWAVEKLLSSL
jgi:signal recognition particle receptor subunit alpha